MVNENTQPEIDWAIAVEELLGPGAQYASADTYEELARTWNWRHLPKRQEGVPQENRPLPSREALVAAYEGWLTKQAAQDEKRVRKAALKSPEGITALRAEIEAINTVAQSRTVMLKLVDLIEALTD